MQQVTFLSSPMRPFLTIATDFRNRWPMPVRCWVPTCMTRPLPSSVLRICLPSWIVSVSGFSQYTSLPALRASITGSECQWSGVTIVTKSMPSWVSSSR